MAEQQGNSGQVEEVETPMLVLWRWRWFMWMFFIGFVLCTIYMLVQVLLVLKTGDYRSMLDYDEYLPSRNIIRHYLQLFFLLTLPMWLGAFKQIGSFYFYRDRLEFAPWYRSKKCKRRVIPYEEMHVLFIRSIVRDDNSGLLVNTQSIPDCPNLFKRLKFRYWDGCMLLFGRVPSESEKKERYSSVIWQNPEDVQKAVELLRENAVSFQ